MFPQTAENNSLGKKLTSFVGRPKSRLSKLPKLPRPRFVTAFTQWTLWKRNPKRITAAQIKSPYCGKTSLFSQTD